MKYKTILFDLDGTILDTNELIISSFEHTFQTHFPDRVITREEIILQMGGTLTDILSQYTEEKELIEEMVQTYRNYNIGKHDEIVTAFPYVQEVIRELDEAGIKMGIVSTKQRNTIEMGLKLCELDQHMSTVVSLNEVENPKPHPEPILKAMSNLGAIAEYTLMVGDSSFDIEAAHRAGVDSAGVAWSLKGMEYLESYSPTYMLHDMRDLLKIVRD